MHRFAFALAVLVYAAPVRAQSLPIPPPKSPPLALAAPAPTAQIQLVPVQQPAAQVVTAQPTVFAGVAKAPRTVTMGPGPLSLTGAWIGRQLVKLDRTHVWTIGHTVYTPIATAAPAMQPVAVAPLAVAQQPVQYFTVAQAAPQPVVQYSLVATPMPVAAPAAQLRFEAAPPPPVAPSPQR